MIVLYLLALTVAAVAMNVMCWRWALQVSGWLRAGLLDHRGRLPLQHPLCGDQVHRRGGPLERRGPGRPEHRCGTRAGLRRRTGQRGRLPAPAGLPAHPGQLDHLVDLPPARAAVARAEAGLGARGPRGADLLVVPRRTPGHPAGVRHPRRHAQPVPLLRLRGALPRLRRGRGGGLRARPGTGRGRRGDGDGGGTGQGGRPGRQRHRRGGGGRRHHHLHRRRGSTPPRADVDGPASVTRRRGRPRAGPDQVRERLP